MSKCVVQVSSNDEDGITTENAFLGEFHGDFFSYAIDLGSALIFESKEAAQFAVEDSKKLFDEVDIVSIDDLLSSKNIYKGE